MIGLALLAASLAGAPTPHFYRGETFVCHFKAGRVVINTREPGTTITFNGTVHPAHSGSYFYEADDVDDLSILFKPGMKRWEFGASGKDIATCKRSVNPR